MTSASESVRDWLDRVSTRFARFATPARVLLDVSAWVVAIAIAIYLRFGLTFEDAPSLWYLKVTPIVGGLQILFGLATGLYRRRWRYGSFDEVAALALTAALTTGTMYGLNEFYFETRPIPQSAVLVGGVLGLMLMAACRYVWRLVLEKVRRPDARVAEKMLVYGAGEGGVQSVTAMLRNRDSPYLPVGLLDDDPGKQRLSIMGVPMLGRQADLARAVERTGATSLLFAVPSADSKRILEMRDLAVQHGLALKVLPSVSELFGHAVNEHDIRDLTEEDLLGRHQVETDVAQIADYLSGQRVLVTGAGGSIGSELCRQLVQFGVADLLMLDRDESALHQVQLSISGRAMLDTPDTILADIRDEARIRQVFAQRRPQVVFHAAALKHLPLLEQYPDEAYKSNVLGSLNVLRASELAGVEVFVNISTDKAANPISVLGYSKRVAERLTAAVGASAAAGTYLSVRFGNVLGSRGSVLTTFRNQVAHGGPITVTDRNVMRYFITIPESVQLVIQAGAIGESGEVLVLDMGEPILIYDVAKTLAEQADPPTDIVITGLRPGEKLHEELFGSGEIDERPRHRLISQAPVPPLDPAHVEQLSTDPAAQMLAWCNLSPDVSREPQVQ
ncbi:MAG TPA: nucleoside-diphosphate sugar epimerase/dehydratase [Ilumatobacter sp.]|nr:nucleoside-diphosphate sugar epimerase/dehydratase [Ilumatobacter sp.]